VDLDVDRPVVLEASPDRGELGEIPSDLTDRYARERAKPVLEAALPVANREIAVRRIEQDQAGIRECDDSVRDTRAERRSTPDPREEATPLVQEQLGAERESLAKSARGTGRTLVEQARAEPRRTDREVDEHHASYRHVGFPTLTAS
jgi:hypothetical protein